MREVEDGEEDEKKKNEIGMAKKVTLCGVCVSVSERVGVKRGERRKEKRRRGKEDDYMTYT